MAKRPAPSQKKPSKPRTGTSTRSKTRASQTRAVEAELVSNESEEDPGHDSDYASDDESEPIEVESSVPDDSHLPALVGPGRGAISATDPLKRYFEEVSRYPLLEPEEEVKLVSTMLHGKDVKQQQEAARRLVTANLRLVVKIAYEYRSVYANLMDLIQEGNIGLMKAVSKYDPSKGARLSYYASWWIRSFILKFLLDNFRLVKVGTTQAQKKLFYHLVREKERLEAQGLTMGPKLLAQKFDVREKDVVEMSHRLSGEGAEVSLDAPIKSSDGRKATHIESLPDEHEPIDQILAEEEWLKILHQHLPQFEKTLDEREQKLFHQRLMSDEPKTLQEVADLYGLTRERARQIEAKIIEKLRVFLKKFLS